MVKNEKTSECVFCQLPGLIETEEFKIIESIDKESEIHLLIIPKVHMQIINSNLWNKLYQVISMLKDEYQTESYSIHMNHNPPRQHVLHSHLHFMAGKFKNDW